MIQPKYDTREALERAKLLMKYDTSKTLTENVEKQKEVINEIAFLPILGWSLLAAGAGTGLASWIDSIRGGGDSFKNTEMFFKFCGTKLQGVTPQLPQEKHREAADIIYNNSIGQSWYQGAGSGNEEAIKSALESMQTPSDLCALKNEFYASYNRDFFDALDSEVDGEDFVKYVWLPIKRINEKAMDALTTASGTTVAGTPAPGTPAPGTPAPGTPAPGTPAPRTPAPAKVSKYKDCAGKQVPVEMFCKNNEIVSKVQGCLGGITVDGAFGPKTKAALEAKGLPGNTITQDTIDKVCGSAQPTIQPSPIEDEDDLSTGTNSPVVSSTSASASDEDDLS